MLRERISPAHQAAQQLPCERNTGTAPAGTGGTTHSKLFLLITLPATLAFVGCSDAEEAFDCIQICNKYSDCFDEDWDHTACVDHCEDAADASTDFAAQADACETCIDDQACDDAAASCADECTGVVAESIE